MNMTLLTIVKGPSLFLAGASVALISPSDITAMTVAIGAFVTAVGVVIVNIITARSAARRAEDTLRKVDVIEGHVNSEKTEAEGKITALRQENALLREIMADKKETAALLAQAAVTASVPRLPAVQDLKEKQ